MLEASLHEGDLTYTEIQLKVYCQTAADGNGGLEAKLADFGLHATIEALDNSSLSKRL